MRLARSVTSVVVAAIAPIAFMATAEAPTTSGSPSARSSTTSAMEAHYVVVAQLNARLR